MTSILTVLIFYFDWLWILLIYLPISNCFRNCFSAAIENLKLWWWHLARILLLLLHYTHWAIFIVEFNWYVFIFQITQTHQSKCVLVLVKKNSRWQMTVSLEIALYAGSEFEISFKRQYLCLLNKQQDSWWRIQNIVKSSLWPCICVC